MSSPDPRAHDRSDVDYKPSGPEKRKEISSKMFSSHRCGKCNRFGHHHDKCTKDQLASKIDSFVSKNKDVGSRTKYLSNKSVNMGA